jgi:peptidoglycan hydrolase-like amidase
MVNFTKILQSIFAGVLVFFVVINSAPVLKFVAHAIDTTQYEQDLAAKEQAKKDKEAALAKLRGDIDSITQSGYSLDQQIYLLAQKITDMENQINQAKTDLDQKQKDVDAKQLELGIKQDEANKITSDVYKKTRVSLVELFLQQLGNEDLMRSLKYREYMLASQITNIKQLAKDFEVLKAEKIELLKKKQKLEIDSEVLAESRGAVESLKSVILQELYTKNQAAATLDYDISTLATQVSDLQRQIITLKSGGSGVINTSSVPSAGDGTSSLAGFRANAPFGSFAVFSIGSQTHRNGMSQWGGQARAEAGQSYEQILNAYYPNTTIKSDYPEMQEINIDGYGVFPFETNYLYGIAEMPENWYPEVLKAQAIAARTYAITRTSNGLSSICVTQGCQVYTSNLRSGAWKDAVDATKGMVLVDNSGNPILSEYASTHGGYINNVGWDTTDGTNNGDWMARAWDSIAGHPWFYKNWYRFGYAEYGTSYDVACDHSPWMTEEEMSDILNIWLLDQGIDKKDGFDNGRRSSINSYNLNKSDPNYGRCIGLSNSYTPTEVRTFLNNPVTNIIGNPIVSQSDNGQTINVSFQTNRGLITIPGNTFKTIFNMRAPGYLRIDQYYFTFFNVERN